MINIKWRDLYYYLRKLFKEGKLNIQDIRDCFSHTQG